MALLNDADLDCNVIDISNVEEAKNESGAESIEVPEDLSEDKQSVKLEELDLGNLTSVFDTTALYPDEYKDNRRAKNVIINDIMKANQCEENYVFEYLGSRFKDVRMVGTVLEVDKKDNELLITIDDGTAVVMCVLTRDCEYELCLRHAQEFISSPDTFKMEQFTQVHTIVRRKVKSLLRVLPYEEVFKPMNTVCVIGKIGNRFDQRIIYIREFWRISIEEEMKHMNKVFRDAFDETDVSNLSLDLHQYL